MSSRKHRQRQRLDCVRRVAIVTELNAFFERETVRGVRDYAGSRGWEFCFFRPLKDRMADIRRFRPAGILVHPTREFYAHAADLPSVPIVTLFGRRPCVTLDNRACGRMQATFYLDRGFRHFAFLGLQANGPSMEREAGFRETLAAAGFNYLRIRLKGWDAKRGYITRHAVMLPDRLKTMPRPVGVAACDDHPALDFMRACGVAGLRVPHEIAVIGTDNDDLMCDLASPSLSSVAVPFRRIGSEAAALLDRLLDGKAQPDEAVVVAPSHVVMRQSTDVMAVRDAIVQSALRTLREFPERVVHLKDLAGETGISARALTRHFQHVMGRSPVRELRRLRLEQAKHLLASTSLSVKEVASRTGWSTARSLARALRLSTGRTPLAFRRWHHGGAATAGQR